MPAPTVPGPQPLTAAAAAAEPSRPAPVGPGPATPQVTAPGAVARCARALLSPWARLALLLVLLTAAAVTVVLVEPQQMLTDGWPRVSGGGAVVLFALAYGVCTAALVPRPILNLAAGALFGAQFGLAAAVAGTVIGAGLSFGLGRILGQDALRPLLRARFLVAADRQLSRHGFRSMLAVRLFPGVPFAAANYCAAVSRMGWLPFLLATGIGCIPNTAAYAIAGSRAATPASPAFLAAAGFIAVTGIAGAAVAWRKRGRMHRN
ncbi:TVP38/TMEM64 family protein [Streptomyces sp. NPDC047108]|uniref:TVP38/TMEM64 family protein n=1 Tax=Streptomyces sp. NPDC047108 TaxID=3155025 RepID=UPI0033FC4AB0